MREKLSLEGLFVQEGGARLAHNAHTKTRLSRAEAVGGVTFPHVLAGLYLAPDQPCVIWDFTSTQIAVGHSTGLHAVRLERKMRSVYATGLRCRCFFQRPSS